jgi:hypothetical protein
MPYFNPFREDRMRRMQELLNTIRKIKECNLDWLLGWGGLKWGSTEESLLRMLRQLEKARMIEIDNEMHKVRYLLKEGEEEEGEKNMKKKGTKHE